MKECYLYQKSTCRIFKHACTEQQYEYLYQNNKPLLVRDTGDLLLPITDGNKVVKDTIDEMHKKINTYAKILRTSFDDTAQKVEL
jgi:uncharacterized protein YlzI (FlbEa/FlbD family)